MPVDCDNICVKVEYQRTELVLLRVDSSASAFDTSYDAWNLLRRRARRLRRVHRTSLAEYISHCYSLETA